MRGAAFGRSLRGAFSRTIAARMTPPNTALAKPHKHDPKAVALEVARASGMSLLRGRVTVPTTRIIAIVRGALEKVKVVESFDLVPGEGDVRIHLVLQMMGSATRVVVRASIASFYVFKDGGALRLRLLDAPSFAGKNGGKTEGMLGMLGAFGEAALSSMGPEGIAQTVARFIGSPLSAHGDLLSVDLGAIPAVKRALRNATPLGPVGDLVHVTGASFRPGGLEIALQLRPRAAWGTLRSRFFGR
jgi:hypothetical protein